MGSSFLRAPRVSRSVGHEAVVLRAIGMRDLAGGSVGGVADVAALDVHALAVADVGDVELDVLRGERGGKAGGENSAQDGADAEARSGKGHRETLGCSTWARPSMALDAAGFPHGAWRDSDGRTFRSLGASQGVRWRLKSASRASVASAASRTLKSSARRRAVAFGASGVRVLSADSAGRNEVLGPTRT